MSGDRSLAGERVGADIVTDPDECERRSMEFLDETGFPRGILPLKGLIECGGVRSTGFVWMKQSAPSQHYFESVKALVGCDEEVTGYIEKHKMTRITGVKAKPAFFWIGVTEMRMDEIEKKIYFKTSLGVGKYFPVKAFMTDEETKKLLEEKVEEKDQVKEVEFEEERKEQTMNAKNRTILKELSPR